MKIVVVRIIVISKLQKTITIVGTKKKMMGELMIFEDKDMFQKERPRGLTSKQEDSFYREIAEKIIDEGWGYFMGNDELDVIVSDLRRLKVEDAYKPVRKLRREGLATYEKDPEFKDYVRALYNRKKELIAENVKAWVKAHNVKAKYPVGTRLMKKKNMFPSFMRSSAFGVKILGIDADKGEYLVKVYGKYKYGAWVIFEEIESGFEYPDCVENNI